MKYLPSLLVLLAMSAPFAASAQTLSPNCAVLTKTASGQFWPMINHQLYLIQNPGEPLTIIWGGANAVSAHDQQGTPIAFAGQQIVNPTQTTTYTYTFVGNGQSTTCSVTTVVFGSRGVLQGSVNSGVTTTTTPPPVTTPSTTTTTTTTTTGSNATSDTAPSVEPFSASEIPLLSGGNATPGSLVPVQYLKLVNLGTNTTFLPGIWLKQDGTAPVSSVIGFTSTDDKGVLTGTVGGSEGSALFQNGRAFIPLNATFAPGQFRIFTIKAHMSNNLSASYGTNLMLDVVTVDTKGTVAGSFPIKGTTWTLRPN